ITSPSCGFSLAVSGMMMPPAVFSSCSRRRTTTRSCKGRNCIEILLQNLRVNESLRDLLALSDRECQQFKRESGRFQGVSGFDERLPFEGLFEGGVVGALGIEPTTPSRREEGDSRGLAT